MHSGPPRIAEIVLAVLLPPACREEVLGDLHERYRSLVQYALDASRTLPRVILSRVRRTIDPQIILMQAFALYMSFVGAACLLDTSFLTERWGLMRLAIPAAMALLGLILTDVYADSGRRSPWSLAGGPLLGLALAFAWQVLPASITFCGGALSLLLSSAIRLLFPPTSEQPRRKG